MTVTRVRAAQRQAGRVRLHLKRLPRRSKVCHAAILAGQTLAQPQNRCRVFDARRQAFTQRTLMVLMQCAGCRDRAHRASRSSQTARLIGSIVKQHGHHGIGAQFSLCRRCRAIAPRAAAASFCPRFDSKPQARGRRQSSAAPSAYPSGPGQEIQSSRNTSFKCYASIVQHHAAAAP